MSNISLKKKEVCYMIKRENYQGVREMEWVSTLFQKEIRNKG